jgi:transposase-like protein
MRIKRTCEEWASICEQQKKSGQTVILFCREKGIHPNVFYRKQKQLRDGNPRFIKVTAPTTIMNTPEMIRIGRIEIEARETISDDFLIRLIRCAIEVNDAIVSR